MSVLQRFKDRIRKKKEPEEQVDPATEYQQLEEQYQQQKQANEPVEQAQREKYKQEAFEDVSTEVPGMSEERKRALQETANKKIDSQIQQYSRMMASQAGRSGIRGGSAAALQQEVAQMGLGAQEQFARDLLEKDQDLAMQKLAAWMASVEGKQAADILGRQQFLDYIMSKKDKGEQAITSKYYKNKLGTV